MKEALAKQNKEPFIKPPPVRLLNENQIEKCEGRFCKKCEEHCSTYSHLVGGRDMQHILTDQEIAELGHEENKRELCELLTIEKGNAAKIMIETISIHEPHDFEYDRKLIEQLFKNVETDYFGRFQFNHL